MNLFFRRSHLNRLVKKMHFPSDQEGLMNRYLREYQNWQPHLANAHKILVEFADSLVNKENLIVFGSGWLLDFPLEELSPRFKKITLVDIHHPTQVRHRVKRNFPNVVLFQADVTGNGLLLAENLVNNHHEGILPEFTPDISVLIKALEPENPLPVTSAVSLNILSQLDAFIIDYLKKYLSPEDHLIQSWRNSLQKQHLELLKHFSPSCLISDVIERRYPKKGGNVLTSPALVVDLSNYKSLGEWTWIFDTTGSYVPGHTVHLTVRAISL